MFSRLSKRLVFIFFACTVLVQNIGLSPVLAASGKAGAEVKSGSLRRADFRVTGTSCPACIMRVEGKIKAAPGVVKAAISIYKPYGAVVLYNPGKTNLDKIFASIKGETVKFVDRSEMPVSKVPVVLVPKFLSPSVKPGDTDKSVN